MSKQFKAKKTKKFKFLKTLFILVLFFFVYQWLTGVLLNVRLVNNNEDFITSLLKDSNHHMLYEKSNKNIANQLFKTISKIDIKKPVTILETVFGYELKNENKKIESEVMVSTEDTDKLGIPTEYIKDPNPSIIDNPRVYIYNTHQLENYSATNFEEYNIKPNVLMASYLLKEKLNKLNILTIAETSNIADFLALNNWDYSNSYKASKFFLTDAINKHNNLDLIIDLHRDSISKSASTVEINGKKYAKILFVVGMEHDNYQANLDLANNLSNKIKEKYPTLLRGVMTKQGKGVNGIYNQNLSPKAILIECGGMENSIDEVMNTIEVLSNVIKEYLG